jgi:hypothetical protein
VFGAGVAAQLVTATWSITRDNSVLILVDHKPWVAFSVKSIDASLLVNNLSGIAASAKALDVPLILTTVGASGGVLEDPPIKGLADVIPDVSPIDRVSTNAWEGIRDAVEATRRRTLLIAGLWTEGRSRRGIPRRADRRGCSRRLTSTNRRTRAADVSVMVRIGRTGAGRC